MNNYLQKSQHIKQAADKFLEHKQIAQILSRYGEVIFAGSYATNLMVWNDIDLQLKLPPKLDKIEVFADLAKHF
jgi:hypothetical protein